MIFIEEKKGQHDCSLRTFQFMIKHAEDCNLIRTNNRIQGIFNTSKFILTNFHQAKQPIFVIANVVVMEDTFKIDKKKQIRIHYFAFFVLSSNFLL